ncbi:MAG: hypothetical protein A3D87_01920 [Omnitrophica WOR_2 bacterium RIFCSPHIGHO2_02_FULL_50_17]|nr:MAG: hypothetical protein A3D87_01920 [Omnitrophica WOR_2 bacterium RIFCSPHIGHO2_02_FULL_50_17]
MKFAKRTDWPLSSNRITVAMEDLRRDGAAVLDLTESNPTRCGFAFPNEMILKSLGNEDNLRYEPLPQGSVRAREAVGGYYMAKGFDVSVENIILTSSTSEAYSYLFRLLVNAGERVLFPRPSYPLFQFLGDLNDVHLDFYTLTYTDRWGMDFDQIRRNIQTDTRALVLVNPNNPTGSFVAKKEKEWLNALCRERNLSIICDEVFGDFPLDPTAQGVSLVNNGDVLTFVLGGLSKTLGLPQMKLSWIILSGPAALVKTARERLEIIADTYLSVSAPVQNSLERWLPLKDQIQGGMRARLKRNLQFLKEKARGGPCRLFEPEGGWYAVLKIPPTLSEEEWVLKFLRKDRVFVHPGYFFDFDDEAFIVVSLLPPEEVFEAGISRVLKRM